MTESDTHCIRRLRFRGRLANPRLERRRVEAALTDGATGARFGKETILCVRRLAIARPRVEQLKGALEAEISAAARPARGFVPANANAVLFADRAELLVCLARDWCVGETANRWWWPVLFPGNDFDVVVRRAWLEDACPVPAALTRLEAAGLAARFLAKLSPVDLATLWRNMVHAFHLSALDAAWKANGWPVAESLPQILAGRSPPWAPWIERLSSLAPEAARIFVTALLLERVPGVVHSVSFTREVRVWTMATETAFSEDAPEPPNLRVAPNETFRDTEEGSRFAELSPGQPDQGVGPSATLWKTQKGLPAKPSKSGQAVRSDSDVGLQSAAANGTSPSATHSPAVRPAAPRPEGLTSSGICENGARADSREKSPTVVSPDVALAGLDIVPLPSIPAPDQIHTDWGGSLYLVNVAIALGLYGDFTTPARQGLALTLWDFLALVGERLIGDAFAADPLHSLFARLSGRAENEPPGADFVPPTGEPLAIWLDRISREIQERVAAALGLDDDCDLRTLLLYHHAKIETTSARVDAYFSLAKHPIELRMAGLDRDPGWVPAGGRSIYFHYD
jgi:hypothetical protein